MVARTKIIALLLLLFLPISVHADSQVDKLNELSDEALQMVKIHRYEDANKILEYFSKQFVVVTGNERPFSADEMRIVTLTHREAVEAADNTDISHEQKLHSATKLRLVMDALSSTYQPLWTEMENSIMNVFGEAKEAASHGDRDGFNNSFNTFLSLYDVIYPSMKLNVSPDMMQRVDTKVEYIDQYRPQVLGDEAARGEIEALEADLQMIFDDMTEDEADPSLWWVIISTGSIIILTLSYVAWKKYAADKKKEKKRES